MSMALARWKRLREEKPWAKAADDKWLSILSSIGDSSEATAGGDNNNTGVSGADGSARAAEPAPAHFYEGRAKVSAGVDSFNDDESSDDDDDATLSLLLLGNLPRSGSFLNYSASTGALPLLDVGLGSADKPAGNRGGGGGGGGGGGEGGDWEDSTSSNGGRGKSPLLHSTSAGLLGTPGSSRSAEEWTHLLGHLGSMCDSSVSFASDAAAAAADMGPRRPNRGHSFNEVDDLVSSTATTPLDAPPLKRFPHSSNEIHPVPPPKPVRDWGAVLTRLTERHDDGSDDGDADEYSYTYSYEENGDQAAGDGVRNGAGAGASSSNSSDSSDSSSSDGTGLRLFVVVVF